MCWRPTSRCPTPTRCRVAPANGPHHPLLLGFGGLVAAYLEPGEPRLQGFELHGHLVGQLGGLPDNASAANAQQSRGVEPVTPQGPVSAYAGAPVKFTVAATTACENSW